MKLRNKKTGEIIDLAEGHICETYCGARLTISPVAVLNKSYDYNSLAELNEEWEDYEEPSKTIWQVKDSGELQDFEEDDFSDGYIESSKSIGNYFETKEEAEKAVEKLKAWKRLKDKGFSFKGYTDDSGDLFSCQVIRCSFDDFGKESRKDLDLLFSGEDGDV